MCSYIDLTNVPEGGFTASEDIVCYKVLKRNNNCLESPVTKFCYKIGKTVKKCQIVLSDKKVLNTVVYRLREKTLYKLLLTENHYLFSTTNLMKFVGIKDSGLAETTTGYYSFTGYMNGEMKRLVKIMLDVWDCPIVVRCTIPKGSKYYVSDNSETFVSNQLKVEHIVNEFEI